MEGNVLWYNLLERSFGPNDLRGMLRADRACMALRRSQTEGLELQRHGATEDLETHREYLLYYALDRLGDRDQAEDVVQETFLPPWQEMQPSQALQPRELG